MMKKMTKTALSLWVAAMMLGAMPVFAEFDVNTAASSVVRVVGYDANGAGTGSAFVIAQDGGSTYLVTNRHVITDIIYDEYGEPAGVYDFRDNVYILLDDLNDVRLKASPIILSEDLLDGKDLAILRVDTGLSGREILPLAPVNSAKRGDNIHLLGFPGLVDDFFGDTPLPSTEEHVTIVPGHITNLSIEAEGTKYLQHNASSAGGVSGGPVIDANGSVIGVHAFTMTRAEGFKGAVHIDYIIEQCERLSIPYVPAGSVPAGSIPPDDGNTQAPGSTAPPAKASLSDYWWIFLIVGIVVVVGGGAAALVVFSQKGKPAPVSAPVSGAAPAQQPPVSAGPPRLICSKGHFAGTAFPVNGILSMGRDPRHCQIVFPNDTQGISSLHCELRYENGAVTLTDRNSSYGTFLADGTKLTPGTPYPLSPRGSFYLASRDNLFEIE